MPCTALERGSRLLASACRQAGVAALDASKMCAAAAARLEAARLEAARLEAAVLRAARCETLTFTMPQVFEHLNL